MESQALEKLAETLAKAAQLNADLAVQRAVAGQVEDPERAAALLSTAATRTEEASRRLDRGQGLRAIPAQYALASLPAEALAAALQVLDRPELAALRPVLLPVLEAGGLLGAPAAASGGTGGEQTP